jgi:hypothetical protein
MKIVKLLVIAAVIVAIVVGISQLLKNCGADNGDNPVINGGPSTFNEISQSIEELKESTWNKDLYKKGKYGAIVRRIQSNREHGNISESEAKTLSDGVELAYVKILIKQIEQEIETCNPGTMSQLKEELDEFAKMGMHDGVDKFKQTVQNMNDYQTVQAFINSVAALKNKKVDNMDTKFPDIAYYINRVEELKENDFVARCTRLRTSLDDIDRLLCEAHRLFLDRKTDLFLQSDFSGLKSKEEVNKKFDNIQTEVMALFDNVIYPDSRRKSADALMLKLEERKNAIINALNK